MYAITKAALEKQTNKQIKISNISFNCLKIFLSGWIISYLLEIPAFPWTRTFPEKEKKKKIPELTMFG